MKILIVDDSKAIATSVGEMLTQAHHETAHAKDGSVARDMIKEGSYDLVLLDWNMPVMSGVEFLEANLSEKFCSSPIIMMTTENKPEYIMKAMGLGASEYIMKPFTSDILISKIDAVVGV